jgi:hypothetical protein
MEIQKKTLSVQTRNFMERYSKMNIVTVSILQTPLSHLSSPTGFPPSLLIDELLIKQKGEMDGKL